MATMMAGWYVIPVHWLRQCVIWSIVGMMEVTLVVSWEKKSVAFLYCYRRQ